MAFGALALLAALLAGLSLVAPLSHDESQYLAAAKLTADWRPYADFLHLQTPLQIYIFASLLELAGNHVLLPLRLATAVCGAGTLAFVYLTQRRLGVEARLALLCAVLLAFNGPFLFGATVVRNDALPALLEAASIAAAACAFGSASRRRRMWLWFLAAALLALAASAKISYLLPLAALGLFHVLRYVRREAGALREAVASAAGAALGLLPIFLARASAPEAFDYGVFHYAMQAPFDWYGSSGAGHRLTLPFKLWDVAKALASGPAAVALVFLAFRRWWGRGSPQAAGEAERLADFLILAGLAAALLPTPTWPQYVVPLLPPLFVRLGLELSRRQPGRALRTKLAGVFLLTALVGLIQPTGWLLPGAGKSTPIVATREARWIGDRMRANHASGSISTLSPQIVLDSGFLLDRRFAAGPFFYRTGDGVPPERQRRLQAVSPSTLASFLDEAPPAAIVTGYETDSRGRDLDAPLRAYAESRGYRAERSPFGKAILHLAPARPRSRSGEAN
jgi:hypothetical protein